jgi:uncharacterized coiled-coil DUF342 family protein
MMSDKDAITTEGEPMEITKAQRIRAMEMQASVMRRQMIKAADAIDDLRAEIDMLRQRGDKLVEAFDKNDGTVNAQWRISDAVSAWQELSDK